MILSLEFVFRLAIHKKHQYRFYLGNMLMFLKKKNDYEAIARMDIRGEVSCVIASIRNSLEAKSNGA